MLESSPVISTTASKPPRSPSLKPADRRLSTSSIASIADVLSNAAASSSSVLIPSESVEVVTAEGLHHVDIRLEARRYKSSPFAADLLRILRAHQVPSWTNPEIVAENIHIRKVSGSMTNAVFFVSCPSVARTRVALLRIYGPSSGSLISRPKELQTLHILSSRYHFGPRVYGTFENGRVEEYFESTNLTAQDLRDPTVSGWIAARMAELHSVDIELVEGTSRSNRGEGKGWEIGVKRNVRSWLGPVEEVMSLPALPDVIRSTLDIPRFKLEWQQYLQWLSVVDDINGGSRRVFAHNDAQYGNLLRLAKPKDGIPPHRQIIVVDFEYASPNPASVDIANHFQEWTADYSSTTPHLLHPSKYPSYEERRNFYMSYLQHSTLIGHPLILPPSPDLEKEVSRLDHQVRAWSPSTHGMWALWGIVQAKEDVENDVKQPEFNYLAYAMCRMASFRKELKELGITV
ncbi:hypothetical protein ONZ45_g7579 [Pleurotus djamor]|nr:hypothetical protein ONZ45_g7579 [Pleurotus djamor]